MHSGARGTHGEEPRVGEGNRTLAELDFWISCQAPRPDLQARLAHEVAEGVFPELAAEVRDPYDGMVEARLYALETGSVWGTIGLVVVAAFTVYDVVSRYHDFEESVSLLRRRLTSLLRRTADAMFDGLRPRPSIEIGVTAVPVLPRFRTAMRPARDSGSFRRWQGRTIEQLGFVNNLLIGLASVVLAFQSQLGFGVTGTLTDADRWLLVPSSVLVFCSLDLGCWLAWNRLLSFRETMRVARMRETGLRRGIDQARTAAKLLDERTWRLLAFQAVTFAAGTGLLVVASLQRLLFS